MKRLALSFIVTVLLAGCSGSASSAATSELEDCGVDATEEARLLDLSHEQFDQDLDGGWRVIADRTGCKRAAASIIETYIEQNDVAVGVMQWHVGQLLALAGDTDSAVPWMTTTRESDETWNLYVDGTVAFLNQDRASLEAATESLAAVPVSEAERASRRRFLEDNPDIVMPDGFVDAPQNLHVLRGLVRCFDQPYSTAYGCEP